MTPRQLIVKEMAVRFARNDDVSLGSAELAIEACALFIASSQGPRAAARLLYRLADAYAVVPERKDR